MYWLLIFLLANGGFAKATERDGGSVPEDVSIIKLIAAPQQFDSRVVRTSGFVTLEPEGMAVYLNKESFDYRITHNAIFLSLGPKEVAKFRSCDKSFAQITGQFAAAKRGHFGLFSGTLENIAMIQRLPDLRIGRVPFGDARGDSDRATH